jgi:hypothetical protein
MNARAELSVRTLSQEYERGRAGYEALGGDRRVAIHPGGLRELSPPTRARGRIELA